MFATLVSLLVDDVPQIGVVSAPGLGWRWWAAGCRGVGAGGERGEAAPSHRLERVATRGRAGGHLDASLDPWGDVWDIAASQVIVEEAGGRVTDLAGVARPDGGAAIVTNGRIHDAVLERLA